MEMLIDCKAYCWARVAFPCRAKVSAVSSYCSAALSCVVRGRRSELEAPCCSAVWMACRAWTRSCLAVATSTDWATTACGRVMRNIEETSRQAVRVRDRGRSVLFTARVV